MSELSPQAIERIDRVLTAIEELAEKSKPERRLPIIGPVKGEVLFEAAKKVQPRRSLELGTLIGYSALILAKATHDGRIVTVEENEKRGKEAWRNFEEAGVEDRVDVLIGDARDVVQTLSDPFDLVFLDIWKDVYVEVLEDCVRLLRSGGVLVADNVLWDRPALQNFREEILSHPRLDTEIFEVEDGVSVSIKR